jgi:stearoyl-CoA desaturase (Delta-9 desaturase)
LVLDSHHTQSSQQHVSPSMASSTPAAQAPANVQPDGTVDYKPARGKSYDLKKPHITEQPITLKNWHKHVNWLNVTFIIIVPLLGL